MRACPPSPPPPRWPRSWLRAVAGAPDSAYVAFRRVQAYLVRDDPAAAARTAAAALARAPEDARLRMAHGTALAALGDYAGGRHEIEAAIPALEGSERAHA